MERGTLVFLRNFLFFLIFLRKPSFMYIHDRTEGKMAISQFHVIVLNSTVFKSCQLTGLPGRKYATGVIIFIFAPPDY